MPLDRKSFFAGARFLGWVPISGYIVARCCHPTLRTYFSGAMAELGKQSLELYVLQFHCFLGNNAADIVVPWVGMGTTSFVLQTALFVLLSRVAHLHSSKLLDFITKPERVWLLRVVTVVTMLSLLRMPGAAVASPPPSL